MVLKGFRSRVDDALLPNGKVLAADLRAKEMQPNVTDDFVELPAASIRPLQVVSIRDVAIRVCRFLGDYSFVERRVLGINETFYVFIALTVVPHSGEAVDWNVIEVPDGHYADSQHLT